MQKSLDQMKVHVHRAVGDLQGASGMAIVEAIVAGQRDHRKRAKLADWSGRSAEDNKRPQ
jgi:hypothetical protein